MLTFAERTHRLVGEGAIETFAKASSLQAAGRDIIHLEIGEPDFDTPPHIVSASVEALTSGLTHYTPAPGIPQLRDAIAERVRETHGIPVEAAQVVVTPGAKPIAFLTMLALLEPGDEVVYPNPGFPVYEALIDYLGAVRVPLRLRGEDGFRFRAEELEASLTARTKLLVLNFPHNPTGSVAGESLLEQIAGLVRNRDVWVLSDEVYSQLSYDDRFYSIASLPGMAERTIILDGFSKTYAMTGWRLGYGVMPAVLAEHVIKLVINSSSCTTTFVQYAGIAALRGPQDSVEAMAAEFCARRDLIVDGLNAIDGVKCARPAGAFYVFPDVRSFGIGSRALADYLLERAGVATLPGIAFGQYGEGYLRLTYANTRANITRALERMATALAELRSERSRRRAALT